MNSKNIFSGGILIFIGLVFLGKEYGWFDIHWHDIARMWPLLLIYIGLMSFFGKSSRSGLVVSLIMLCIFIPLTIAHSCKEKIESTGIFKHHDRDIHIDWDDDDDEKKEDNEDNSFAGSKQQLTEPMNNATKQATFELNGGAAEFVIESTTKELVEADADLDFGKISLKKSGEDANPTLNFALKGKKDGINFDSDRHNKVNLKLNDKVIWDMKFEFGAGKADFDLSPYQIKNLSIKTGVTETDIKLGDRSENLNVEVESGLTSIEFAIPTASGCRIKVDGGLNAKNFEGFIKNGSYWETPGYEKAAKKIQINFEGGLQDLKVERY